MIKFVKLEEINNLEDFKIIVPSNYEIYYKKKFLDKNCDVITLKNFFIQNYNGSSKLINGNEEYVIMYNAFKNVMDNLSVYNEFISYNFIKELINTYNDFNKYDLNQNDKINDLRIIFEEYERLLASKNLINLKLLYDSVLKNNCFTDKYLFLNLSELDKDSILLIRKMNEEGTAFLNANNINNKALIRSLKRIDNSLEINTKDITFEEKEFSFKSLNDISEEVSFINNDITKKIMEGNCYSDFIIVSNDIKTYTPYFDLLLNHPYSKKCSSGLLTSRFVNLFCNILNGDFSCKNFINILKLGLFDVDMKIIDKLDNYIYLWDLEDAPFYASFMFNPNGNKKNFSKQDEEDLKKLNDVKDEIINPIKYLLENVTGDENKTNVLSLLYTYLSEEKIMEKLFLNDEEGALNLVNALENLNDYLEGEAGLKEIINILVHLNLSSDKLMNMQDNVQISNLSDAVYEDKKFVYVLGCSNDVLPKPFKISSLINNNDLKKENLVNVIEEHFNKEYYLFSRGLNNKNVTLTYHKLGVDLKLKTPSNYLNNLSLKNVDECKLYDKSLIVNDYALKLSDDEINHSSNEYFSKINDSNKHDLNYKIDSNEAINLYGNSLNVSPSSIETYAKCAFYHFCNYGLKLKVKEKYTFDNREVGTFVHYVLEKIIKSDLNQIDLSNIEEYVYKYASTYLEENNKIINNASKFVIESLSKNVSMIIKNILKEQQISKFKPKYFEFKIGENSIVSPIKIKLNKGELLVSGIVDRVDTFEDDENYYYRIIDYKTGEKKFRLDDVLDGLNLQMLLYLLAIKENKNALTNKKIVPSALLYYPALLKESMASRSLKPSEKNATILEKLKMNGIVNKDKKVLDLLGSDDLGDYVAVTTRGNLNEEKLFGMDNLEALFDNIKETLKRIGDSIISGDIKVNPLGERIDACAYCKFNSICKFDSKIDKKRKPLNYKNSEVFKMLEGDIDA